jgi:hypothetical protein
MRMLRGGAVGAALVKVALKRKWVIQDLDSRALTVTKHWQTRNAGSV